MSYSTTLWFFPNDASTKQREQRSAEARPLIWGRRENRVQQILKNCFVFSKLTAIGIGLRGNGKFFFVPLPLVFILLTKVGCFAGECHSYVAEV